MATGYDYYESRFGEYPDVRAWSIEHRLGSGPFTMAELSEAVGELVANAANFEPPKKIEPKDVQVTIYGVDEIKLVYGETSKPPVKVTDEYTILLDSYGYVNSARQNGKRPHTHPQSVTVANGTHETAEDLSKYENKNYKSEIAKETARLKLEEKQRTHGLNRKWWFENYSTRNLF